MATLHHVTNSSSDLDNARPLPLSLRPAPLKIPPRNPNRASASLLAPHNKDDTIPKAHESSPQAKPGPKRRSVASRLGSIISKFEMLDAVSSADVPPAQYPSAATRPSETQGPASASVRKPSASRHSIELSPYRVNPPSRRPSSSIGHQSALLASSVSPERPHRGNKSMSEPIAARPVHQNTPSRGVRQGKGHQSLEHCVRVQEQDGSVQYQHSRG